MLPMVIESQKLNHHVLPKSCELSRKWRKESAMGVLAILVL